MTTRQPQVLPEDVFVDPVGRQDSRSNQADQPADLQTLSTLQNLNRQNTQSNRAIYPSSNGIPRSIDDDESMSGLPPAALSHIIFETHTTTPSPPLSGGAYGSFNTPPDTISPVSKGTNSLSISTDTSTQRKRSDSMRSQNGGLSASSGLAIQRKHSASNLKPVARTPSWKQHFAKGISSATSSAYPSPVISAMGDVTPLPSPLLSSDSPGPWRRLGPRPPSRDSSIRTVMPDSVLITKSGESVAAAIEHQHKRKAYVGLNSNHLVEQSSGKVEHVRNRSISEYVPDAKGLPRRQITVSSGRVDQITEEPNNALRREPNLSESRGVTPATKPPTPPPSESSQSNDGSASKRVHVEFFEAHGRKDNRLRRWRGIKHLGEGTFSRVILATTQLDTESSGPEGAADIAKLSRKQLVAIKICEHGPKGGASEDRIEMSLKRELDILQSVHHPSLVHLKAWNIEPTRALLVLSYCSGGDLFDVASTYRDSLTASLIRRIFAEVVDTVRYLHDCHIVHRDIKLENVLVNLRPTELKDESQDWATYPYPVITVTDLGLSRRVTDDEKLETRCGSDDYAAPEVILGQPYDGRATDAWSLGVLLYALIEARLPFDPPPGASDYQRMRSRTSHRIARVEWTWVKYAGDDGDHDANLALFEQDGLAGAMEITEGLLRRARSRWPMGQIAEREWVRGAIQVEGGIQLREEEEGQVVL
ncbi:kinase-like protein [Xylariaceae sp. FL1272]|nr:kinase-like protein [Xylariaceae sp. FL1272]